MPTRLSRFLRDLIDRRSDRAFDLDDPRLAVAALMAHVVAVDGAVTPREQSRWEGELARRYDMTAEEARALAEAGRAAELETSDLMTFTAGLTRRLAPAERLDVVRMLWEMVLADGEIHEFEDNVVWRIADLLGIGPRDRMLLRKEVEAEHEEAASRAMEEDR